MAGKVAVNHEFGKAFKIKPFGIDLVHQMTERAGQREILFRPS